MITMKKIWILTAAALLCFATERISAQIETGTTLGFTVSSLPEAQLALTQRFTIPVLRGDSFLTSGNNLQTALSWYVTPVSMNAGADFTLTPIAFAQLKAGAGFGTGWNFPALELAPHAWGINKPQPDDTGLIAGKPFEAAIWNVYGGAVFQFDVGAVIPGDWTHVLVQTTQQFSYRANTLAKADESWSNENVGGENRNGAHYYGVYVLGYQFPAVPVLDMAALMVETGYNFYDTPNRAAFGDDLFWWTFSGLVNYKITPWLSAAVIAQFTLDRNFTGGTEDYFYQERILNQDDPQSLNFYRVAMILSFTLR
jgi:hypothetical protein